MTEVLPRPSLNVMASFVVDIKPRLKVEASLSCMDIFPLRIQEGSCGLRDGWVGGDFGLGRKPRRMRPLEKRDESKAVESIMGDTLRLCPG